MDEQPKGLCPMKMEPHFGSRACYGEYCAWWLKEHEKCVMPVIAVELHNLKEAVESLTE